MTPIGEAMACVIADLGAALIGRCECCGEEITDVSTESFERTGLLLCELCEGDAP